MDQPQGQGPINHTPAAPLVKLPPPGEALTQMVTYIDLSTPAGKSLVYNSLQGQDEKLESVLGMSLRISNFVLAPVALEDKVTGEERVFPRTVLITDKNERIGCVSDGIMNSLRALIAVFGPPPWVPALPIKAKQQSSQRGNRFYILEVDGMESVAASTTRSDKATSPAAPSAAPAGKK